MKTLTPSSTAGTGKTPALMTSRATSNVQRGEDPALSPSENCRQARRVEAKLAPLAKSRVNSMCRKGVRGATKVLAPHALGQTSMQAGGPTRDRPADGDRWVSRKGRERPAHQIPMPRAIGPRQARAQAGGHGAVDFSTGVCRASRVDCPPRGSFSASSDFHRSSTRFDAPLLLVVDRRDCG